MKKKGFVNLTPLRVKLFCGSELICYLLDFYYRFSWSILILRSNKVTKSTIFRLQVVCHGITLCRQRAANPNSHRSAENSPNPKSLASILRDLSLSEEWTYSLQFLFLLPSFRISGGIASFPLLGLREIFRRSAISPFRISVFFFCRSVIPHSTVPSFLLFCPHVKQNSVAGVSISSCLCVFKEC